jgi:molybdopterin synthase catalytic subunit
MKASMTTERLRVALVDRPIDPQALIDQVADEGSGATALFLGTVRNTHAGRAVCGIDYEAYSAMAEREMRAIVTEASHRYEVAAISVEHRVGYLAVGEVSVAIAASHAHRQAALGATHFVIDEIKQRVPIWKREHFADGTSEWVDPTKAGRPSVVSAGSGSK